MKKIFTIFLFIGSNALYAQVTILPSEASLHIGETVIVPGVIYGGYFFEHINNKPTLLILGSRDSFSFQPLTLEIDESNLVNFPVRPEQYYFNKELEVKGMISLINGFPGIILTDSSQVTLIGNSLPVAGTIPVGNMDIYNGCGLEGTATSAKDKDLDAHKNRYQFPTPQDIDNSITLSALLQPGNDLNRWNMEKAAEITGYVILVKDGGAETCNCKSPDKNDYDTHIEIVSNPNKTNKDAVIIEITPRLRKIMLDRGIDWSTKTIKATYLHTWVKVKGWMLCDYHHIQNAKNTRPAGTNIWRGTIWEVHPVTSIGITTVH